MHTLALMLAIAAAGAQDIGPSPIDNPAKPPPSWPVADAVANMVQDPRAVQLFKGRGLDILSLTWEDTGRWKNSCWGPNIADLTIQVLGETWCRRRAGCMPVVRYPNFADKSCDLPIGRMKLLVGNERGSALGPIDLKDYLAGFAGYQTHPTGRLKGSLVGTRDSVVLASAQACFLPIPQGGEVAFAPVLFSYQASPGAPAVLAILVTPEGSSAQVIDNSPAAGAGVWHGQRLYHNRAGQRTALSARRFSDHQAAQGGGIPAKAGDGLSLVLVIQVPLVHPEPVGLKGGESAAVCDSAPACKARGSDVETAVIASGPVEGPWLGLNGCTIERDWRFPIRVTVQFYQATSSAEISQGDADRIAAAIERIYLDADAVGSLVTEGYTGRPTEHDTPSPRPEPPPVVWPQPWWQGPCLDYEEKTGGTWQDGLRRIRDRLGRDWQPRDERELRNALALVRS